MFVDVDAEKELKEIKELSNYLIKRFPFRILITYTDYFDSYWTTPLMPLLITFTMLNIL